VDTLDRQFGPGRRQLWHEAGRSCGNAQVDGGTVRNEDVAWNSGRENSGNEREVTAKERMRGIYNSNLGQLLRIWVIDGGTKAISR
jgi:hypothetical protein